MSNQSYYKKFKPDITITAAFDGKEALEKLANMEPAPDIILFDINMPGMGGLEFLETYAKQPEQSSVVAMLISSEQDKNKFFSYDFVKSYFIKPVDEADLKELVDLFIK